MADESLSLPSAEKSFLTAAVPSIRLARRKSASSPARMCPSPFPMYGREERSPFCRVENKADRGQRNGTESSKTAAPLVPEPPVFRKRCS